MKIRIGNDFKTKWAITWLGEPEDFSDATDISLFFNIYDKKIELTKDIDYTITDNVIEIDVTPDICNILGIYNLELHYTKPNDDFIDGERRSAVDIDAFRIVGKSEKADATQDVSIISDAVAIFLDVAYKKLEEIEANEDVRIASENEREDAEDIRVANEDIRISNEQDRQTNTTTAISNAEQATLNANSSAVYANEQGAYAEEMSSHPPAIINDYWHIWNFTTNQYESTGQYARGDSAIDGALVVQEKGQSAVNTMSQKAVTDDLALKANHGYASNPKTLKEVDDTLQKIKDIDYESKNTYNGIDSKTILPSLYVINDVGDFFEIDCEIMQDVSNDPLYRCLGLIGSNMTLSNSFGTHPTRGWTLRQSNGVFVDLGTSQTGRVKMGVEVVEEGWQFSMNGEVLSTKPKTGSFIIRDIANAYISNVFLEVDIYDLKIHSESQYFEYTNLEVLDGSENVKNELIKKSSPLEPLTINPQCFVSFNKSSNKFTVYTKDKSMQNTYYGFDIILQSSLGNNNHDVNYAHLWRLTNGYMYNYVNGNMIRHEQILLGVENEFTYLVSGKGDHTGGVHGDERIDIDSTSGVTFYINGIPLTIDDLSESFDLLPCNSFYYLQKSTLHETATHQENIDTGIEASGEGVVTITPLNEIVIDGITTGIFAYNQASVYTAAEIVLSKTAENKWQINTRIYFPVAGHPIIGEHIKKTTIEKQGYKTWNRVKFKTAQSIQQLFTGLSCIHKNTAKFVNNENYVSVEMTGSGPGLSETVENRLYEGYNPDTKLSSRAESWLLKATNGFLDKDCRMHVSDRLLDSKYYRKVPSTTVVIDDLIECEMVVEYDKKN